MLLSRGYRLFIDSPTNQQFVVLPNEKMERIREKCAFCYWEKLDDENTVVRFATGFHTKKEDVEALSEII